jgi:hypothetical protein
VYQAYLFLPLTDGDTKDRYEASLYMIPFCNKRGIPTQVGKVPSSSKPVDDIAASEDILGEIILYKPLRENIFVYFVMSALYIYNNIIF